MRVTDLIIKKRNGETLSPAEIEHIINHYVQGDIPDYQMAAFCMAVYFRGMTDRETACLTLAMANSGDVVDLTPIPGIKVDKHSTGGVADTTTLVLAPLVAAAGVPVAKMAGRGLGHTGGTIDKLESIPGFRTALSGKEFLEQVRDINLAVVAQSGNLAPADKKLYALRDVTGTVESIPLIASSIMSKKIAAGAQAIVLDVKLGSGAFMKKEEDAFKLAETMVAIGRETGRETVAVVSDMNEPLGRAIGNALEVEEAIQVLRGEAKGRLRELALLVGSYLLQLAGKTGSVEEGRTLLQHKLDAGAALEKFAEMIRAQGGNPAVIVDTSLLPQAAHRHTVECREDGYLLIKDAQALGLAAMLLGAGRETKDSLIDLAVGLKMHVEAGDKVKKGQPLLTIFYNDENRVPQALKAIEKAVQYSSEAVPPRPLVYGIVTK